MFDVILFNDPPEFLSKTRGYGPYRLATHLRQHGYSCLVVDYCSVLDFTTFKTIMKKAVGPNTLMVGLSTTWFPFRIDGEVSIHDPNRKDLSEEEEHEAEQRAGNTQSFSYSFSTAIIKNDVEPWFQIIKDKNPNTKMVLGGAKVSMYMDIKMIDYVVLGMAETMLIDLADSLSGKTKRIFNKIIDHDQKAQSPVWDFRESFTSYTEYDVIQPQEALSLEVGRGCRFKCTFCSYPLIGQRRPNDYLKYPNVLRNELYNNWKKWGTTRYFIMDDTFNDSNEKMQMFLDVVKSLPFKIEFWCYLRLDLLVAFPEQIKMLKEMGLNQCYFGIETFNQEAGKRVGKGCSPKKQKQTLYECKRIWGDQVHIQAGFIVGLPYEDSNSIMETAQWLAQADCPIDHKWIIPLSIAGPHEATKYLYKSEFDNNYEKYGYTIPDLNNCIEWNKDDGTDILSNSKAEQVALEAERLYENKPYKGDFSKASLNHPILSDRNTTLKMTDETYQNLLESIDQVSLYVKTVKNDYFKPLIRLLQA